MLNAGTLLGFMNRDGVAAQSSKRRDATEGPFRLFYRHYLTACPFTHSTHTCLLTPGQISETETGSLVLLFSAVFRWDGDGDLRLLIPQCWSGPRTVVSRRLRHSHLRARIVRIQSFVCAVVDIPSCHRWPWTLNLTITRFWRFPHRVKETKPKPPP